jgi:hypothetical protein
MGYIDLGNILKEKFPNMRFKRVFFTPYY